MSICFPRCQLRISGRITGLILFLLVSGQIWANDQVFSQLREELSRAGIFFRADTPTALRNAEDPYLPIYLQVINGIEKTGRETTLSQYVKRDPLRLEGINIYFKPAGPLHQFVTDPLLLDNSKEFSVDARTNGQPLVISERMRKTLEVPLESIQSYLSQHYVGQPSTQGADVCVSFRPVGYPTQNFYLRVRLKAPPLPQVTHWYRGDTHYHSAFTDNPAERGNPLGVTKQVALQADLNWLVLADHSTDLTPERYEEELREVRSLRDGRFVLIRGEEVTVASNKETTLSTLHLLALPSPEDPDKGFPDPSGGSNSVILTGTGSISSPPLPLQQALRRIAMAGGFAYAAHPFDPISPVVRGGTWDIALDFLGPEGHQLPPGLIGLEPWNRATMVTADDVRDPFCLQRGVNPQNCFQPDPKANQYTRLEKAIELGWEPLLAQGLKTSEESNATPAFKVFLAAGSDAHGDFDYEATMDVIDFIRKPSRLLSGYAEDNALGKLSTVVYSPTGMGPRGENVLLALRQGRSVTSNGPLVIAGFDRDSNGSLDDPQDVGVGQEISSPLPGLPSLQIFWVSSSEFGPVYSLRLVQGSSEGEAKPEEINIPPSKAFTSGGLFPLDLRPRLEKARHRWNYLRLEARTRNSGGEEFRCYTNPIWVRLTDR